MTFSSFLRLARITNLPTVVADVVAGFLIAASTRWIGIIDPGLSAPVAGGTARSAEQALDGYLPAWVALVMLGVAGCCLYTSGMIDNDVRHARKDQLLDKRRPIPMGEVRLESARYLSNTLALAGILLASLSAVAVHQDLRNLALGAGGLAIVIVLASRHYNTLAAGHVADFSYIPPRRAENVQGMLLLGLCRMCDIGLGVALGLAFASRGGDTLVQSLTRVTTWVPILTAFSWFALVTALSVMEDSGGRDKSIRRTANLLVVAGWSGPILLYVTRYGGPAASLPAGEVYSLFGDPRWATECLPALILLLCAFVPMWWKLTVAAKTPSGPNVGKCIGWGIASWPLICASMVMLTGTSGPDHALSGERLAAAMLVAAMTPLALLLRRVSPAT